MADNFELKQNLWKRIYIDIISFNPTCVRFGMCRHCIDLLEFLWNMGWSCRYEIAFCKDRSSLCEMKHSNDKIYYESYGTILSLNIRVTVLTKMNPMLETNHIQEPHLLRQTYCKELEAIHMLPLIARFMEPSWGPSGACRTQVGPMLAPWRLLSGNYINDNITRTVQTIFQNHSR